MGFAKRLGSRVSRGRGLSVGFLEAGLWLVALICGGIALSFVVGARAAQRQARLIGTSRAQLYTAKFVDGSEDSPALAHPIVQSKDAVIGRLEVPGLALSVPVLESDDQADLKKGVGHIPGTAGAGGLGNFGLAGHRDTYLRPLRNIRRGMEIDVVTSNGEYHYQVDSTEIVTPDQVQVLDVRNRPELTLVTCYPFWYIGAAPRRFIVHAHLLSLIPS